ncbi:MAG: hypothetical protein BVN35_15440 [Proteobacteria bacterium ST_bin11]|nr:MAG: hypothetical protein BVN35_15440 [Proteobacteria bacterium ST_bin11]
MNSLFIKLHQLFGVSGPKVLDPLPDDAEIKRLIADIRSANLSYCGKPKLENIADAVLQIRRDNIPGNYLEAGVALGGSAILLALLKPSDVEIQLYDIFGMIPSPGENDGEDAHQRYQVIRSGSSEGLGGETYYGYVDGLLEKVKENLRQFGLDPDSGKIRCIPGLFEDTLYPSEGIAFAHIDCDWYDSVKICIERIAPKLSPGGIMIFDDYSSYSGCRRAVDEWLERDCRFEKIFLQRSLGIRLSTL